MMTSTLRQSVHRLSIGLASAACLLAAPAAWAQTSNDATLAALAEDTRDSWGSPAVGLMQLREGEVHIGVAGLRDVSDTAEVSTNDLWHLGSNTKSMTATLVARLAESGVISWDDTVSQHLGEHLELIDPGFHDVTFRHLLSHQSGAPANIGQAYMMMFALEREGGRPLPEQRLSYAGHILALPPESEPGSTYLYSNAGYVIAGAMLEQATGEAWEVLIEREVMTPLGIDDFGFGAPGSTEVIDQPRGHLDGSHGNPAAMSGPTADNPPVLGPAGTMHMSLPDYALYLQAHIDGGRGVETGFLSQESWDILHTRPFEAGYAMGWGLGSDELQHSGSNRMWLMHTVIVPDQQMGAVIAMNRMRTGNAGALLREIATTARD